MAGGDANTAKLDRALFGWLSCIAKFHRAHHPLQVHRIALFGTALRPHGDGSFVLGGLFQLPKV